MTKKEEISKNGILHRIIKILLIVVIGLLIIYGAFYAIIKKGSSNLSPSNCEEKVWCLDYDTLAHKKTDCSLITTDCSENERCLNGECVLRG